MRYVTALVASLLVVSCGGSNPPGSSNSSGPRTQSPRASPASPSSRPTAVALSGTYGLLIAGGSLELIRPDASVAAKVAVAPSSVQYCSSLQDGAMEAPPVSATDDAVYFRDGDTKIRQVVPPSSAVDVTTVPGGANVVSFFSVSPDDQRIVVLVEDLSGATNINERLYVEDLHGGGHHADIFTTQQPKGKTGTTLWPMGWHQGALVLAVVAACTFEPYAIHPSEWHVSNAGTANRIATIRSANCVLSQMPSPAGVGCTDSTGATTMYDWTGKLLAITGPGVAGFEASISGLSPAGQSIFFSALGLGAPPATRLVQLGPGPYATVQGHSACAWIDEDHVLAPDAVIQFPAETPGNLQVDTTVTPLPQPGVCAGRFPGAL